MKTLNDYKEEIHKCSKCGLCQSVCPVYDITGNDCAVSRGKFIMLNGVVKGDLKLNKTVDKYLDMCLKCNACKNFCPSDIDARKIFLAAKAQYFNSSPISIFKKAFHSKKVFNLFLNCAKITTNTYRFLRLDKLARNFYQILEKFELGKKIILYNEFVSLDAKIPRRKDAKQFKNIAPSYKIVYFKGCVNQYINPRTKIATENILKQIGVKILSTHLALQCCGVPFLSSGNAEQFKKQAEYNLAQIPEDFDYFITDCASCQGAFRDYENYIEDEKLLEKLRKINEKSINVVDFILKNIKSIEFKEKTTFTFHKPCHLDNISFLEEFLNKAKNVEYIEMKDFDTCCGFAGEFSIKNPEISKKISDKKIKNALATNADYILTSCPSCILGLNQGLIEAKQNGNYAPMHPCILASFIEFISLADTIL